MHESPTHESPTHEEDYVIRPLTGDAVGILIDWAAAEGWNPGLHDAACFHAADPGGFLIGELAGDPIAAISAVKYGDSFGFLGCYIVRPEFRGQGYGIRIWNAALACLAGRNIGLDGVVAQQDNYRKSGFSLAYRNIRFEGQSGGEAPSPAGIVDLGAVPFDVVEAYDRAFFPAARTGFLRAWLEQPDAIALGLMSNNQLSGYGVLRACRSGYKVGPLFADTAEIADALFRTMKARVPAGQPVYLDVPEPNAAALALVQAHGMQRVFETARMYTGPFPDLPLERLFGVSSFELG